MSILYVGALAQEIANGTLSSTAGTYDADYAPGNLNVPVGNNTLRMVATPIQSEAADIWFHCNWYISATQNAANNNGYGWDLITALDTNGVQMFAIGDHGGFENGTYFMLRPTAGETGVVSIANVTPVAKLVALDLHWIYAGGVTTLTMYIDGLKVATATGTRESTAPLGSVQFGNMTTTGYVSYSEVIMTGGGESTLGWRLSSMLAAGDGAVTEWHGTFSDLATADTTTGIWTDQANKHHIGTFAAYNGASNPLGIRALVQFGRFIENSSGLTLQGSLYNTAGQMMYDTYTQNFVDEARVLTVWDKNPTTGNYWRPSEFTGFQGGFKSLAA